MARLLSTRGITRIRPLAGGFQGWRDRDYPLEPVAVTPGPPAP
jgi:rhodanese-related sulfurtransferase